MVKEKKTPKIRPEYRVVSSGALDLANFAGEIVSNPDTVLVSLGGELKNYAKLLRDDQVHRTRSSPPSGRLCRAVRTAETGKPPTFCVGSSWR